MDELLRRATEIRTRAYAPYSGYTVGAALAGPGGRTWVGTNFENVSYGATICAERAAVAQMIADGGREISSIALSNRDGGTPCGICLQVLLEFTANPAEVAVMVSDDQGAVRRFTLAELMPFGFHSDQVHRT